MKISGREFKAGDTLCIEVYNEYPSPTNKWDCELFCAEVVRLDVRSVNSQHLHPFFHCPVQDAVLYNVDGNRYYVLGKLVHKHSQQQRSSVLKSKFALRERQGQIRMVHFAQFLQF